MGFWLAMSALHFLGVMFMLPFDCTSLTRRELFRRLPVGAGLVAATSQADDRIVPVQARRTRDFIDFLGVNTHFSQRTSRYRNWRQAAIDLDYVGIRTIRDGCSDAKDTLANYRGLVQNGVGICAVYNWDTLQQTLAAARNLMRLGPHALVALEGPNEPNNFPMSFEGKVTKFASLDKGGTFLPAARLQAALYREVKRDPVLRSVPVWQISMAGAEPDNCGLQFLSIPAGSRTLMPDGTIFADVANLHVYTEGGSQAWTPDHNSFADELSRQHHRTWGYQVLGGMPYGGYSLDELRFPAVISEIGYHTNAPTSRDAVDGGTQAKNLLDAAFDAWTLGFHRFILYELYDSGSDMADDEAHYGLFDADLRPKPAARALHELARLIRPAGRERTFLPGVIGFRILGLPQTADSTLLQGDDGIFRLIVWNSVQTWNSETRRPVQVTPTTVRVQFDKPWSRISTFDLLTGSEPLYRADGARDVTLALTDHPLVVVFADQAAP